jgi:hypothetical protein
VHYEFKVGDVVTIGKELCSIFFVTRLEDENIFLSFREKTTTHTKPYKKDELTLICKSENREDLK